MTQPLEQPLEALLAPLLLGRRRAVQLRRRRTGRRAAAGVLLGALVFAGTALATIAYLGQPAPPSVKKAFRAENARLGAFSDRPLFMPLLDVRTAQTVAVSRNSVLYGAQGAAGNYCTVLLRNGKPVRKPNVQCEFGVYPKEMRVDYERILTSRQEAAPIVFSGRLSSLGRTLRVQYANGLVDRVPIGLRGYFVYQPAGALQRYAKTGSIRFIERNARGTITDVQLLQPPVVLSQDSATSPHLARGRVFIRGARYVGVALWVIVGKPVYSHQQGSPQLVRVAPDGRFVWQAPKSVPKRYYIVLSVLDSRFRPLADLGH